MIDDLLAVVPFPWENGSGDLSDIILDSRVQLSRNLSGHIFPGRATDAELAGVMDKARSICASLDALGAGTYELNELAHLPENQRNALAERHLITSRQCNHPRHRGLLLRNDGAVLVRINDEDHFCMQAMAAGLQLEKAKTAAFQVDDAIESKLDIAFRDDFGYMTADPANAGTGMHASVTLHVPAIVALKRFNRIVMGITKAGFSVRGLYGRPMEMQSHLFVITNEATLGIDEADIIDQLQHIAVKLADEERQCRDKLMEQEGYALQNRLCRAYGIVSQAWLMKYEEALSLLSQVRLAIDLGMISERPLVFETLLSMIGPGMIHVLANRDELTELEQDILRARIMRETLTAYAV